MKCHASQYEEMTPKTQSQIDFKVTLCTVIIHHRRFWSSLAIASRLPGKFRNKVNALSRLSSSPLEIYSTTLLLPSLPFPISRLDLDEQHT